MQSIFNTTGIGPPPEEETETEEGTDETKTEEPMIQLPDGTRMSEAAYKKQAINEEMVRVSTDWERAHQSALDSETETSKSPWAVEVAEDTFQSDVEKSVVGAHNELSDEVAQLRETVHQQNNQRKIDEIARTKGVTEEELQAVYDEYGGEVKSLDALADLAASKKSGTTRIKTATDDRREAAATISGSGNSQTSGGRDGEPKGRGLTGKEVYDGTAIAAKYSAFGS